ncbi:uncharacterized protein LOC108650537 [Drosophila navojoa]|uniref:uncharacterized protein LOC108650537 n=1 Tax=Drosophila navojoa TaxID=7232 RepID=UPI000846AF76|nr:uncharacterized protein LOC108650537 [Drosophila navojoa]
MAKDLQIVLALFFACLVAHVVTDCNVCQTNQAACINSTSFYLCFGDGMPHTDRIYNCLEGTVCTARTAICVQKNALWPPSCGDTSKCGQCSAHRNHKFACQSRRTFQMCYGATRPTGALGFCPPGYACDASSDVVCTPERVGQTFTCDLHDDLVSTSTTSTPPTTVTTASPTPSPTPSSSPSPSPTPSPSPSPSPTPDSMTAQQLCQLKAYTGLYETQPRDIYCRRYISCYYNKAGQIRAVEYQCAANAYFDAATQRCVYVAPANCTAMV